MRRFQAVVCVLAGMLTGCTGKTQNTQTGITFSDDEKTKMKTLSPLPETPPADPTNAYADNAAAATLGQKFFHDKTFSGPITNAEGGAPGAVGEVGKIACASCHDANKYFTDSRSQPGNVSHGTDWMVRNAHTAINSSFYTPWNETDGVRDSQWSDSLTDPEDVTSMNSSRCKVARVIYEKYRAEYNAIFTDAQVDADFEDKARYPDDCRGPSAPGGLSATYTAMAQADQARVNRVFANFGKAMQAYLRKLVSRNAPFDKFVAGDDKAISDSAKRGLKLFIGKAGCAECHSGPLLSDNKFHDIGLAASGDHVIATETGRYDAVVAPYGPLQGEFNSDSIYSDKRDTGRLAGLTQTEDMKGQWRTKQLRGLTLTAPYMHTGQYATLDEVVGFYDNGGADGGYVGTKDEKIKRLNMADGEKADLVEFLKTLTGDPIPAALTADTSNP